MLFLFFLAFLLIKVGIWVYKNFIYKSTKVKKYVRKGHWAVITGCTAGIGEGFAYELARRGMNLLLVSRNQAKIESLIVEINKKYTDVELEFCVIDFSTKDLTNEYELLSQMIADKKVTVLVNNIGINTKIPQDFLTHNIPEIENMMHVNLMSMTNMTHRVLPKMLEINNGLVINMSSYSAFVPAPYLGVYAATKSYISTWSRTLREEYKSKGIEVVSFIPMFVKSNMSGFRKTSLQVPSASKFARCALDRVKCPFDGAVVSPYWPHSIVTWVMNMLPEKIVDGQILKKMKGTRRYMLKKKARLEKEKKA